MNNILYRSSPVQSSCIKRMDQSFQADWVVLKPVKIISVLSALGFGRFADSFVFLFVF